jgi:2-dehydro-3-deoxyphosphogluconate aldolase/(4S)-4-hydroxy-2-oxoglutarate aldolase
MNAARSAAPFDVALLRGVPVIPVLVIDSAATAVPLARALVAGGLHVLEVTLRTEAALAAVSDIARQVPGCVIGVGSVIDTRQFARARDAGARFAVSPGATPALIEAAWQGILPWLPGAGTVSEILQLADAGFTFQKFFPAAFLGGVGALRAIHGPVPHVRFCPTGGIDLPRASDYLALENVQCVGGSWVAPRKLVDAGDWAGIEALAREARALRSTTAPKQASSM